jgi:hypothetical protein
MGWIQSEIVAGIVIVYGTGNDTGVFVYSPTPALGNLIASITDGTSDPFGNDVSPGISAYQENGTALASSIVQMFAGQINIGAGFQFAGTGGASPAAVTVTAAAGSGSEISLNTGEDSSTDGPAFLNIFSQDASGSGATTGYLQGSGPLQLLDGGPVPASVGQCLFSNANGTPSAQSFKGLNGQLPIVQTDGTAHAAAAATALTPQQLGKAYSIPISDSNQFTTYRYTIWGVWANGATAEAFTPQLAIAGTSGFGDIGIGSVAFPANHAGTFRIVWDFQLVTAPGSGAKWNLVGAGTLQDAGVNAGNTQASYALSSVTTGNVGTGGAITQSTLSAISVGATCSWGGNGGGTITGYGTTFERLGP